MRARVRLPLLWSIWFACCWYCAVGAQPQNTRTSALLAAPALIHARPPLEYNHPRPPARALHRAVTPHLALPTHAHTQTTQWPREFGAAALGEILFAAF